MISIIIPIYNVEPYLERCLNSIMQQTYKDFEVLMMDDGSTDNSAQIAQKFAENDQRFQYFYYENKGVSIARNRGLSLAKGEYISFVDSDDYLSDDYLFEQMKTAVEGGFDIVGNPVQQLSRNKLSARWKVPEGESHMNITSKNINQLECWVHSRLFKKSQIDRLNLQFMENIIFEDILFSWQILISAQTIGFTHKGSYIYNRDNDASITRNIGDRGSDLIKIFEYLQQWLKQENLWEEYQYAWFQKIFPTSISILKFTSNRHIFAQELQQSLKHISLQDAKNMLSPFDYKMFRYLKKYKNLRFFYLHYRKEKKLQKISKKLFFI